MADTVTMFRPVGPEELELLSQLCFRKWPPRLPDQPFFYPVTNADYAAQIARDWNVKASGFGAVTRFEVKRGFAEQYQIHQVGGSLHQEWWIPAEDLDQLNENIVGLIQVLEEFRRED